MRCYTNQHQFYCGIDFHARRMSGCIVGHDGELRVHCNMTAAPEPFLKAIAPDRDNLIVAVACLFPWDWLAELWAHEGMPFVRGQALSMKAIHGGTAKNDPIDAPKIAALLRGGRLPQAAVSPAARRATRDLLRRRTHLMRTRAARLAPVHNTKSPYRRPEIGKKIADQANREGVAERKMGYAHLKGAFSEAAALFLRTNEAGQKELARVTQKPDQGKALPSLAPTWARAVYDLRKRKTALDMDRLLRPEGSSAGAPGVSLAPQREAPDSRDSQCCLTASENAQGRRGPVSQSPALCLAPRSGSLTNGDRSHQGGCAAPLPRLV